MTNNPWTPASDAALTHLWGDGISTAQIGVQMNRSKNSIVGRAKRLKLQPRPSPIVRTHGPPNPLPARRLPVPKQTLEPLSFPAPIKSEPEPPAPIVRRSDLTCQFIFGHGAPWQFCGQGVRDGSRVWCDEHYKRVFFHKPPSYEEGFATRAIQNSGFMAGLPPIEGSVEALPPA